MKNKWLALKNLKFRNYIFSQIISSIGTNQQNIVLTWLTFSISNSPAWVAIQFSTTQIPVIFLSTYAGHIVDRIGHKKVLIGCSLLGFLQALILGLLVTFDAGTITVIVLLSAIQGIIATFELNARQTLIVSELTGKELTSGLTLNGLSIGIGRLAGTFLLTLFHSQYILVFFFNAITFLGVAIACLKMSAHTVDLNLPKISSVKAISTYFKAHFLIRSYFGFTLALGLLGGFLIPSIPPLAKVLNGDTLKLISWLTTWSAIGNFLSSLSLPGNDDLKNMRRSFILSCGLTLFSCLVLSSTDAHILTSSIAIASFSYGVWSALLLFRFKIQQTAPAATRGKIIGFYSMLLVGSVAIGGIIAGQLLEKINHQKLYAIASLFSFLILARGSFRLKDRRKRAREPHPKSVFNSPSLTHNKLNESGNVPPDKINH